MDTDNIDESSYDFARKKYRLIPADKVDDYEWLEKNRQERKDQAKLKMSNLMQVLKDEAVAAPSEMERKVQLW